MSMAMVISPQDQAPAESANGHLSVSSSSKAYPPAAAQYEELVQSSELFWEKLKAFHQSFGTKFMVPTVGGKALDLHLLFVEVTSRSGLEKVIKDRKWKEVIAVFNFPTTITSASFVLRKYYMSLLYHFEQVYYFRRQAPSLLAADPESGNEVEGSVVQNNGASTSFISSHGKDAKLHPGCSVTGFIDGKFDNGYLVTVNLGNHELKGVLYHIPQVLHMSQSALPSEIPARRKRRRSRMKLRDPFRPKSNRSGYNFFFAEHYARLKPQYYGRERAISKKIGYLWNNLTEAEKQVYQDKGVRDKERYKSEMQEYRSSQGLNVGKV